MEKLKVGDKVIRTEDLGLSFEKNKVYTIHAISKNRKDVQLKSIDGIWYSRYFKLAVPRIEIKKESDYYKWLASERN